MVSLKAMLPAPLLEANEATVLFWVLSVMELPFAATETAPPLIAPVWVTAPAAVTVTVPVALMADSASGPVVSLTTTSLPLLIPTVPSVLLPVRLIAVLAPVAVRVVASIVPGKVMACPTVSEVVAPETFVPAVDVTVPEAAESVVSPLRDGILSIAPTPTKAMLPAVAVMATVLPSPVVWTRPLMVTLLPVMVTLPSVV